LKFKNNQLEEIIDIPKKKFRADFSKELSELQDKVNSFSQREASKVEVFDKEKAFLQIL
jgi:hypothetical protein